MKQLISNKTHFPQFDKILVISLLQRCIVGVTNDNSARRLTYLQYKSFETLRGKEKLLIMSKFSLSHSVSYTFGKNSAIFLKFKIVACGLTLEVFHFGSTSTWHFPLPPVTSPFPA